MRKIALFVGFQFLFLLNLYANVDSTGVKNINGKLFILHKVEKGQGLYGIARRYGSSVPKIQEANPGLKTSLTVGEIIMVPCTKPGKIADAKVEKPAVKKVSDSRAKKEVAEPDAMPADAEDKTPIYHTVLKKETLYQIAVNHKLTVNQLKKWNNLDAGLKVGDKIIVGYKEAVSPVKPITKAKTKPEKANKTVAKAKPDPETLKQQYEKPPANTVKKEVTENGMGTWVDDGSVKSSVNLAMHKTAPVGTIIRLKNPMNGRIKYVKVIGELPKTEENDNILIKIGKNTADDLDIRDKNFRIEMTYSMDVEK